MTDNENQSVEQELDAPSHEAIGEDQEQVGQEEAPQPVENDTQKNFRQLRESNNRLKQKDEERDKMMYAMQKQIIEQRNEAPKQAPIPVVDELAGVDPTDWLTYEQSKTSSRNIAAEEVAKQFKVADEKRRKEEAPQRVKSKLPDFDTVVTTESMEKLKALEPDVWKALTLIGDEETQAVAAYKYVKALVPKPVIETEASRRIQDNANRPKSLSASKGSSPLTQAGAFENGLTPALQAHLLAEMNECASRA